MEHFEGAVRGGLVFEFDVAESVCVCVRRVVSVFLMCLTKSICGTKKVKRKRIKRKGKGKSPFAQASTIFNNPNRDHLAGFFKFPLHIALSNIEEKIADIESGAWWY